MTKAVLLPLLISGLIASSVVQAGIIQFYLDGQAGTGLFPANEIHTVAGDPPGTGGMLPAGLSYDTTSFVLDVNVAWGSVNGFIDLTGNATAAHIHGIVAGDNPFLGTAGALYNFATSPNFTGVFDTSASAGSIVGTVFIEEAHREALMEGRLYINVHTSLNVPGEIRGNLVPVPEPGETGLIMALGALGFAGWRLRSRHQKKA